ncbi:MAG: hypothetical protein JXO22_01625 [Phycisphaerae bacterium]|nr:hypothetical protein [Phycisphaerae bacterium]
MSDYERQPGTAVPRQQTVYWIIALLLAVIAASLWVRTPATTHGVAWAQAQPMAGARGIFAFTGQLDRNSYGLFMLDVDHGTLWCYEMMSEGDTRRLRLVAARTYMYDRYLQDFNCAPPDFRTVQQLVTRQRQMDNQETERGLDDGDVSGNNGDDALPPE